MPTPRTWLERIDEILSILRADLSAIYDRSAVELLFQLQRRRAITLMNAAGADHHRLSHTVTAANLIAYVEMVQEKEAREQARHRKTIETIADQTAAWRSVRREQPADKPLVSFPVTTEIHNTFFSSLPHGIEVKPGRITISFDRDDPQIACQLLYALSMALVNDLGGFQRLMQGKPVSDETSLSDLLLDLENSKAQGIRTQSGI